jgi:hypothetical protein
MPASNMANVDLPDPLWPVTPMTSPALISKLIPRKADRVPNRLLRFFTRSNGSIIHRLWLASVDDIVDDLFDCIRIQHLFIYERSCPCRDALAMEFLIGIGADQDDPGVLFNFFDLL